MRAVVTQSSKQRDSLMEIRVKERIDGIKRNDICPVVQIGMGGARNDEELLIVALK